MTLEKVKEHKNREDLFANEVLQKSHEVDFKDKLIIKEILIDEIS
ncbi:MAG: hypothetical protein ACFE9T_03025 [Promethearchaeota archaeon]